MSTAQQWLLLLKVHVKMMRVKAGVAASRSKLMSATILGFLASYAIAAYLLFREGLEYVAALPAAGGLISDRLVYVMFFCFMMMLIFSVAVTSYISLYRNRDTRWLLTLPVSHQAIFLWKCFESATFSSWGLIFILTPLLIAFANIRNASPDFYLKTALILILFLVLASAIGALVLITATRWLKRKQIVIGVCLIALFLIGSAVFTAMSDQRIVEETGIGAALTFQRVLHHTAITVNRGLPGTWVAGAIIDWTRPFQHYGNQLYPTLLLSHALMAILLLSLAGKYWFYPSWNRSLQHSASSALRRNQQDAGGASAVLRYYPRPSLLARFIGRPLAAISRKDYLTFFREPAQWVQFSLVFGLLAIYASGLRQMNGEMTQPRDLYLVAFLNLAVCALALSTLTTRFVFPQFSLEGRRLWILAMSPLKLQSIVMQKFVTSTVCSGLIVIAILFIGGYNLQIGFQESLFFATAIALLALGLNGLAVGLGVLFPNLQESNAAKIVSGFGGTLCLVGSFIYILAFILILAFLRWDVFKNNAVNPQWYLEGPNLLAVGALLLLTSVVTVGPLFFSQKKLKRLEILTNL
jgi:ABC-2 type transport system permease protein